MRASSAAIVASSRVTAASSRVTVGCGVEAGPWGGGGVEFLPEGGVRHRRRAGGGSESRTCTASRLPVCRQAETQRHRRGVGVT